MKSIIQKRIMPARTQSQDEKFSHVKYNLFILVMCILVQRISNPSDFVKYSSGKMSLNLKKRINCSNITIAW